MDTNDWGNLALGLGTLVVVGAVANKMMNNKPMFKQSKPMKVSTNKKDMWKW